MAKDRRRPPRPITKKARADAEARLRFLDFKFVFDFGGDPLVVDPRRLPHDVAGVIRDEFLRQLSEVPDGGE